MSIECMYTCKSIDIEVAEIHKKNVYKFNVQVHKNHVIMFFMSLMPSNDYVQTVKCQLNACAHNSRVKFDIQIQFTNSSEILILYNSKTN